nr:hypothetical protein [Tanacetum cinerariifolium]
MTRIRHGKCASPQVVLTSKAKSDPVPATPSQLSPPRVRCASDVRPLSYSHVKVWSWGHARGETNACCFLVRRFLISSVTEVISRVPDAHRSRKLLQQIGDIRTKETNDEEPEDLRKPYKGVLKSLFSRQTIEFSAPNHRTPTNLKIYNGSTGPNDHITRFVGAKNPGEWRCPCGAECSSKPLTGQLKD